MRNLCRINLGKSWFFSPLSFLFFPAFFIPLSILNRKRKYLSTHFYTILFINANSFLIKECIEISSLRSVEFHYHSPMYFWPSCLTLSVFFIRANQPFIACAGSLVKTTQAPMAGCPSHLKKPRLNFQILQLANPEWEKPKLGELWLC